MTNLFSASIFSGWQIALIVIAAVLIVALVVFNVLLAFRFRIESERKMFSDSIKNKREALVNKLNYLNGGGEAPVYDWIGFATHEPENEDEDEETAVNDEDGGKDGEQPRNTVLMSVDDLSPRMRTKLGMRAKRFNGKNYYVRYFFGFEAKLRFSDDDTKARYLSAVNALRAYKGVTLEKSFFNQRLTCGGETLATFLFIGKRLCVALALDPENYSEDMHGGENKSGVKRFQKTPLLIRNIGGEDKSETLGFFYGELAKNKSLVKAKSRKYVYDLCEREQEWLVTTGAVRIAIVADAPASAVKPTAPEPPDGEQAVPENANGEQAEPEAPEGANEQAAEEDKSDEVKLGVPIEERAGGRGDALHRHGEEKIGPLDIARQNSRYYKK